MKQYRIDAPIDQPLPDSRNFQRNLPPTQSLQPKTLKDQDPLIAWGWEKIVYALVFILMTVGIAILGILNKKIEYVVIFAFFLTGIALVIVLAG